MFGILRHSTLALLVLVLGLAGCAGMEFEPLANSNDGYDNHNSSDDGMYD